jgi:release factor glutamine methyltransferase
MAKALPSQLIVLPKTLNALYKAMRTALCDVSETADLDARLIIEERSSHKYLDILTDGEQIIAAEVLILISQDIQRRLKGEPLAKIYGYKEFWGRRFIVTPDVLDPRPDTESIIEAVLEWYDANKAHYKDKPLRIVDVGTGTGCIIITLLKEITGASGVAIDYSWPALLVAKKNADVNQVSDRLDFVQGDYISALGGDVVDLIITNPPYIPSADIANLSESVKSFDPILALDGGKDGLDPYKKIFISIKKNLRTNGRMFVECGYDQIQAINRIGENTGTTLERIIYDLGGHARGGEFSCGDK